MFKNNFNSGELSPNLWGRSDLEQFKNGCALARNFIPLIEGPLRRRAGFWYAGMPKFPDQPFRMVEFVRALDEAYIVELGHNYTRFWGVDGQPILSGGVPYEIVSPYSSSDLEGLRWKLIGDALLFGHRDGRSWKRLQKVSETSWNWADYRFDDGPWFPENSDIGLTIAASNYRSTVTLTANFSLFVPGMVGTHFRLRASTGLPGLKTWASDVDPFGYGLRISNGRVYYATNHSSSLKTGNTPPSHDIGDASDGVLIWRYVHDNSGIVRITSVTSPTSAQGIVIRNLPTVGEFKDNEHQLDPTKAYPLPATFAWSEAMYSDYRGWPTAWPELREERLIVGGGRSSKDRFNASQTAGYYAGHASFRPGLGTGTVLDDDAIQGFVGDDSFKVMWFVSSSLLIAGTHGGEAVIVDSTGEAPLTPAGAKPRALYRYGSADVRPLKAQDSVVWVARSEKSLRDLTVSAYDYPGVSTDLSFIAKHIADRRFIELAYAGAPDYQIWARTGDNQLACFIYNKEQNIKGWAQQTLGGDIRVESLCVVPDAGGNDRLWIAGVRQKAGVPQRLIMWLSETDERMRLDCAGRYFGAAVNTVTVGTHLNGETVTVMIGDGSGKFADAGNNITVTGGQITLPLGQTATEIVWGLHYTSRFESLPLTANDGQGRKLRLVSADVAYEGVNVRGATATSQLQDWAYARDFEDTAFITPRHCVETLMLAGSSEPDPRLVIEVSDGFDFILKSYDVKGARGD